MDTDINDLKIAISILDLVLSAFNIIVVCLLGFVVGRVQISLYRGMNELAGYIRLAVPLPNSDAVFNIIIENRGYTEQRFNIIRTDKGELLDGVLEKVKPQSVVIIPLNNKYLPVLRRAKEIYLLNGLRRKKGIKSNNNLDQWQSVKIIKEKEIKEALMEYDKKAKS